MNDVENLENRKLIGEIMLLEAQVGRIFAEVEAMREDRIAREKKWEAEQEKYKAEQDRKDREYQAQQAKWQVESEKFQAEIKKINREIYFYPFVILGGILASFGGMIFLILRLTGK